MSAGTAASPTTLELAEVSKSYGSFQVLDAVSFSLDAGTTTVIGGINGSGKSTLLRCIAGLARFRGEIRLGAVPLGRDATPEQRRKLSYLPQSPGLPESGTVAEILDLFSRLRQASPNDVPLPEDFLPPLDARLRNLSGGQQQRVALTIAMLGDPRLLLLDEPTANLDHQGRESVWKAINACTEQGGIVVIASPAPTEVDGVADRVIELVSGSVASDRRGWE